MRGGLNPERRSWGNRQVVEFDPTPVKDFINTLSTFEMELLSLELANEVSIPVTPEVAANIGELLNVRIVASTPETPMHQGFFETPSIALSVYTSFDDGKSTICISLYVPGNPQLRYELHDLGLGLVDQAEKSHPGTHEYGSLYFEGVVPGAVYRLSWKDNPQRQ